LNNLSNKLYDLVNSGSITLGNEGSGSSVLIVSDPPGREDVISGLELKGKDDSGGSISRGGPKVVLQVLDLVVFIFLCLSQ